MPRDAIVGKLKDTIISCQYIKNTQSALEQLR